MSLLPKVSGMVNIPRTIIDEFYRYKMPVLRAKVEGRGNGVKTRIENMAEIAQALSRPPSFTTKFMGYELGSQTSIIPKNHTYLVNGRHDPETLSRLLDDFIERYVLCKRCGNPETSMECKNGLIDLRCMACGQMSTVDVRHRLASYILKNPPPIQKYVEHKEKSSNETEETGLTYDMNHLNVNVKDTVVATVEEPWQVDVTPEAVEERRRLVFGFENAGNNGQDPMIEISELFDRQPALSSAELVAKVTSIGQLQRWKESALVVAVFGVLFNQDIIAQLPQKIEILKPFVRSSLDRKMVLYCLERLCQHFKLTESISKILYIFFDRQVLDEEILDKWYNHPSKKLDPVQSKKIREVASAFINWMHTAEEEDEDDEDEEGRSQ